MMRALATQGPKKKDHEERRPSEQDFNDLRLGNPESELHWRNHGKVGKKKGVACATAYTFQGIKAAGSFSLKQDEKEF